MMWVDSRITVDEVRVIFSEFRDVKDASREGVMTMAHVCCIDEALLGVVCMGFLML